MKTIIASIALVCASCFATSGELDKAVASIADRIDTVANDAAESSQAVRDAWARGEITAAEMERKLQDVRSATLALAKEAARDEFGELADTIKNRPEVVANAAGQAAKWSLPGAPGEILALMLTGAATYFASTRKADKDTAYDIELERARAAAAGGKRA